MNEARGHPAESETGQENPPAGAVLATEVVTKRDDLQSA